jgi:hypothetical protein
MTTAGFTDYPIPSFAAHVCFELHEPVPGHYRVRVLYNPEPLSYGFPDDSDVIKGTLSAAPYFRLAGAGQRLPWNDREYGDMSFEGRRQVHELYDTRAYTALA